MSTIGEVFPPDDPVARFMVAMAMARNDVRNAVIEAGKAADRDEQELLQYWFRVSVAHFSEAEQALRHWRQAVPQVRGFIDKMAPEALDQLRSVARNVQLIGPGVLSHSRDRTFHYPYPTGRYPTDQELIDALEGLGDHEVTLVVEGDGLHRMAFGDRVALTLALGKYDEDRLDQQIQLARDGSIAFINFVTVAWKTYQTIRELSIDPPRFDPPEPSG
jgi:hypothetical protein